MLKKKKTEAITKATYRELPNGYLETIQKGAACQWHAFSTDRNGV